MFLFLDPIVSITISCSLVVLAFLGFVFLLHPKFNKHPYKLIGITCLVEAHLLYYADASLDAIPCKHDLATYWAIVTSPFTYLAGKSLVLPLTEQQRLDFIKFYLTCWKVMNVSTAIMIAILNMYLFVDLYYIIVNPFYERNKRARIYFISTAVLTLIVSVFVGIYTRHNQTGVEVNDFETRDNLQA
jgi:hypothetical protein